MRFDRIQELGHRRGVRILAGPLDERRKQLDGGLGGGANIVVEGVDADAGCEALILHHGCRHGCGR